MTGADKEGRRIHHESFNNRKTHDSIVFDEEFCCVCVKCSTCPLHLFCASCSREYMVVPSYLSDVAKKRLLRVLAHDLNTTPRLLQQRLPRLGGCSEHIALANSLEVVALSQQANIWDGGLVLRGGGGGGYGGIQDDLNRVYRQ